MAKALRWLWRSFSLTGNTICFSAALPEPEVSGSLLEEVLRIEGEALKVNSSINIWARQCRCLIRAFNLVADYLKAVITVGEYWIRFDDLDDAVMKELVYWMQKGLEMLRMATYKGLQVRTLHVQQEYRNLLEQLQECVRLMSLSFIRYSESLYFAKERLNFLIYRRVKVLGPLCFHDLGRLLRELDNAFDEDRDDILQIISGRNNVRDSTYDALERMMLWEPGADIRLLQMDESQLHLKKHISSGAFGAVYEATWHGCSIALKVFDVGDTSFEKELSALVSLKHPNVVSIIGFSYDIENRRYSLAMERMDTDLEKFIEQEMTNKAYPLPLDAALSIILQVARGMSFLHSNNVFHRDIKSRNILLRITGYQLQVKVADFGTARTNYITSQVTHATPRVGTGFFRAPEVLNICSSKAYSRKADVYSFAKVCYYILTGRRPAEVTGTLPAYCPESLRTLLEACWNDDADVRPPFSEICENLRLLRASVVTRTREQQVRNFEVLDRGLRHSEEVLLFPASELKKVTIPSQCIHDEENVKVYRGVLLTGHQEVAVKVFPESENDMYMPSSWDIELRLISRIQHKNIVRILGFCDGGQRAMVSEYMPKGTLCRVIAEKRLKSLSWKRRLEIATGIAKALAYLHSLSIVHMNVQPSSIFLDDRFGAKLGSLENARLCSTEESRNVPLCSMFLNSFLYHLKCEKESDVCSFGVVMLQLLKEVGVFAVNEALDLDFQSLQARLEGLLQSNSFPNNLDKYLELAVQCLNSEPEQRPTMHEVVEVLISLTP